MTDDNSSAKPNMQVNNPLHGLTLEAMLTELVNHYGWESLAQRIKINCFAKDPSIKSSLKFLRRTPWAWLLRRTVRVHVS